MVLRLAYTKPVAYSSGQFRTKCRKVTEVAASHIPRDPRILRTGAFVEEMLQAGDARLRAQRGWSRRREEAQTWIARACQRAGITPEELRRGCRRQPVASVRAELAVGLVTEFGHSFAEAARHLGISTSGVAKILRRRQKA